MRLRLKKTHSQQQLAVKLRVEPERSTFLTWERRRLLIHAAKTALAAALCWWLAMRFGLHDGYWGSISAIIVLQSDVGSTIGASRERLLGTLIGALLGFSFSLFGPLLVSYILALLAAVIVSGLLGFRNSSRLACVTITIIMLVHKDGPRWGLAFDRVGEVLLGIIVALAVTTFVLPDRARLRLRDGLAQEFLMLGGLFEAILEGFRGAPSSNLSQLRADVQSLVRDNNRCLRPRAMSPPAGRGGAKAWSCFRSSAAPFLMLCWHCSFRLKAAAKRVRPATGARTRKAGRGYSLRLPSRGRVHSQVAVRRSAAENQSRAGHRATLKRAWTLCVTPASAFRKLRFCAPMPFSFT